MLVAPVDLPKPGQSGPDRQILVGIRTIAVSSASVTGRGPTKLMSFRTISPNRGNSSRLAPQVHAFPSQSFSGSAQFGVSIVHLEAGE
jgi:hypothetical protein